MHPATPADDKLVFLHIPKTAGSSFTHILKSLYDENQIFHRMDGDELIDLLNTGKVHMIINTLTRGKQPERDGFRIRRSSVERGIPCLTSLDTARALITILQAGGTVKLKPVALQEAVLDRSPTRKEASR